MAGDPETDSTDARVRRGAGRMLANLGLAVLLLALTAVWAATGFYQLRQAGGETALILRLGAYQRTVSAPGWHWHLPPPLETHQIANVDELESVVFGSAPAAGDPAQGELTTQTRENNIVNLSFALQYKIKDPFEARYQVADQEATLRSAAQAAVREVVGRTSIDDVLSEGRGQVQAEAQQLLEQILGRYEAGIDVDRVLLQEVAPPAEVRDAFDDVIAASQDQQRKVQEAEGYRNEVLPRARAEAIEIERSAEAYRDSNVAEAAGEADRFTAILAEYQRAPEVTRRRLYLEAMEEVLPRVQKLIIEPGTAAVLPYLPGLQGRGEARPGALP